MSFNINYKKKGGHRIALVPLSTKICSIDTFDALSNVKLVTVRLGGESGAADIFANKAATSIRSCDVTSFAREVAEWGVQEKVIMDGTYLQHHVDDVSGSVHDKKKLASNKNICYMFQPEYRIIQSHRYLR